MLERVGSSAIAVASKYWDIDAGTEAGAVKAGAAAVASVSAAGALGLAGVEVVHTFGFINTLWAVGAGAVSLIIILCPPIKANVPKPYIPEDAGDGRAKADKCPYPEHGDDCKMIRRITTYDTLHVYNGGSEIVVIHGPNRRAQ